MPIVMRDGDALAHRLWCKQLMLEAMRTGGTSVPGWILARRGFPISRQLIIDLATDIQRAVDRPLAEAGLPDYLLTILTATARFEDGLRRVGQVAALSDEMLKEVATLGDADVKIIRECIRAVIADANDDTRKWGWK